MQVSKNNYIFFQKGSLQFIYLKQHTNFTMTGKDSTPLAPGSTWTQACSRSAVLLTD